MADLVVRVRNMEYNIPHYDEEKEIWKLCSAYDNYLISNYGRVKRLPYTYTNPHTNKTITYSEKIKSVCETSKRKGHQGYLCTRLVDNAGHEKTELIHRMVAKTFISNPNDLPCVNHINGNKFDNRVENLEWCSYSENNKHAYLNNLKEDNIMLLMTDDNGKIIQIFNSITCASEATGIGSRMIKNCVNGNSPDYFGCRWLPFSPNIYRAVRVG